MIQNTAENISTSSMAPYLGELKRLLDERLSLSESVRDQHGHDESFHASAPPEAVVYPKNNQEIAQIVKICALNKKPIIPTINFNKFSEKKLKVSEPIIIPTAAKGTINFRILRLNSFLNR